MKETYDLEVKRRSRNLIYKFIARNVSRPYKNRVLTLPGHECLEIFEIWDKLNIPRQQLTCLEREDEACKTIFDKKLGFKLIKLDFIDYSKAFDNDFDIICLDFQGQVGTFYDALLKFLSKATAKDLCVITAFSGRRESRRTQRRLKDAVIQKALMDKVFDPDLEPVTRMEMLEKSATCDYTINNSSVVETNSIKYLIYNSVKVASTTAMRDLNLTSAEIDELCSEIDDTVAFFTKTMQHHRIMSEQKEKLIETALRMRPLIDRSGCKYIRISKDKILEVSSTAKVILSIINFHNASNRFLKDCSSYKYVSDGGTPMYIDCLFFKHLPKPSFRDIWNVDAESVAFLSTISDDELCEIISKHKPILERKAKERDEEKKVLNKLRAFIGNEKYVKPTNPIKEENAMAEKKKDRSATQKDAAHKAWITMRTRTLVDTATKLASGAGLKPEQAKIATQIKKLSESLLTA